jgi:hypothetical protein
MPSLHIPLLTYAHNDRAVGVLLRRDDARLLTLAGGRRGVLQRALNPLKVCGTAAVPASIGGTTRIGV